jgi:WD40 repeat protein
LLLWADDFGLWWADLRSGRYERREMPGLAHARFNAGSSAVLLAGNDGLKRWPLRASLASNSSGLEFAGTAQPVGTNRFPLGWPMKVPSNRAIAIAVEDGVPSSQNRVLITDERGGERIVQSPSQAGVFYTALSPDGRWLALSHYIGSTCVLDVHTGEAIKNWPELQFADVIFTPDGRWLITGTGQEYQFWEVGTWQPGLRIERGTAFPNPGSMAFSHNGRLLGIIKGLKTIELLDWQTGEIVGDLVPPQPQHIRAFGFSPDDRVLAVIGQNAVHLWDLRELRRELAALKLDWNQPPDPPSTNPLGDIVFRYASEQD